MNSVRVFLLKLPTEIVFELVYIHNCDHFRWDGRSCSSRHYGDEAKPGEDKSPTAPSMTSGRQCATVEGKNGRAKYRMFPQGNKRRGMDRRSLQKKEAPWWSRRRRNLQGFHRGRREILLADRKDQLVVRENVWSRQDATRGDCSLLVETQDVGMGEGASSADWSKTSGSRGSAEKEGVGKAMFERGHVTPRECREQGKPAGSCIVGPPESCVDDRGLDWCTLHYIEKDLQKFEGEQETQEQLQMLFLDGREEEQLIEYRGHHR